MPTKTPKMCQKIVKVAKTWQKIQKVTKKMTKNAPKNVKKLKLYVPKHLTFVDICHEITYAIWHFKTLDTFNTSWHLTLHDIIHFMTFDTSWHLTLHVIWHFMTFDTLWHLTLHDIFLFMTFDIWYPRQRKAIKV